MNGAMQQVIRFFDVKVATTDVSNSMALTGVFIQAATMMVQIIGFIAISIWVLRIGVDILLLTTKGTAIAEKLDGFGTGDEKNYESATAYISGNLVQIALMVVLIVFLITGWIFKLFSLSMTGIGMILSRILSLDVGAAWSQQEVLAWRDNVMSSTNAQKLAIYDEAVSEAQGYAQSLYDMRGAPKEDAMRQEMEHKYTNAMMRAQFINTGEGGGSSLAEALNKPDDYFGRHLRTDAICNAHFLEDSMVGMWDDVGDIRCSTTNLGTTRQD